MLCGGPLFAARTTSAVRVPPGEGLHKRPGPRRAAASSRGGVVSNKGDSPVHLACQRPGAAEDGPLGDEPTRSVSVACVGMLVTLEAVRNPGVRQRKTLGYETEGGFPFPVKNAREREWNHAAFWN